MHLTQYLVAQEVVVKRRRAGPYGELIAATWPPTLLDIQRGQLDIWPLKRVAEEGSADLRNTIVVARAATERTRAIGV